VAVRVPQNATLDFSGHGWMCNRGFVRQAGGCVAIRIPEHASLDVSGRSWTCDRGYRRQAQTCVALVVPEHASLDETGHAWVCDPGFQPLGGACVDAATAKLQRDADKAVNTQASGKTAPRPTITIQSGENRQGTTNKARVVIGRF
jgi:hypothetical protein